MRTNKPVTVGQLIGILSSFHEDTPVLMGVDLGEQFPYGTVEGYPIEEVCLKKELSAPLGEYYCMEECVGKDTDEFVILYYYP